MTKEESNASRDYIVGIHRYCFRAGEPALIKKVVTVHNANEKGRPCFLVVFENGGTDLIPLCDIDNYKIISHEDVLNGNLPEITN